MNREEKTNTQRKACVFCQHYFVTWDSTYPYGCRKLGFKSPIEPAKYVARVSGMACQSFERKWVAS